MDEPDVTHYMQIKWFGINTDSFGSILHKSAYIDRWALEPQRSIKKSDFSVTKYRLEKTKKQEKIIHLEDFVYEFSFRD